LISVRDGRPPREPIDRVLAALAEIGRPITRSELGAYGRGLPPVRAAELGELLGELVRRGDVRAIDGAELRIETGQCRWCKVADTRAEHRWNALPAAERRRIEAEDLAAVDGAENDGGTAGD
jgi:hypothetical protein